MEHIVDIHWDDEVSVWYAVCDSIPLVLESDSFDKLVERVKLAAPELLELNGNDTTNARLLFRAERRECIA